MTKVMQPNGETPQPPKPGEPTPAPVTGPEAGRTGQGQEPGAMHRQMQPPEGAGGALPREQRPFTPAEEAAMFGDAGREATPEGMLELTPELARNIAILRDPTKSDEERIAAARATGLPPQVLSQVLAATGEPEGQERRDIVESENPVPAPLTKRIRDDESIPESARAEIAEGLDSLEQQVAMQKILAEGGVLPEGAGELEDPKKVATLWRERLERTGKSLGKGLVTLLLATIITYIFLLKLYAGAAAKKR